MIFIKMQIIVSYCIQQIFKESIVLNHEIEVIETQKTNENIGLTCL